MNKLLHKYVLTIINLTILVFCFCSCSDINRPTTGAEVKVNVPTTNTALSTTPPFPTSSTPNIFVTPPATPNTLNNGTLVQIFPKLVDLSKINKFNLADDWNGNVGYAPLIAHYTFTKQPNYYDVVVDFRSGAGPYLLQTNHKFTIPSNIILDFLKAMINIPLNEGKYEPELGPPDNYPSIKFDAIVENENLSVFTDSSTIDYVPWGAKYSNREFIVTSNLPTKVLKDLRPYLKKDIQRTLARITPGLCVPGFPCP